MPKDPTRNINQYKIGGGQLNEFDFQHNQTQIAQEEHERFERRQEQEETREGGEIPPGAPLSPQHTALIRQDKFPRGKSSSITRDSGRLEKAGGTRRGVIVRLVCFVLKTLRQSFNLLLNLCSLV